MAILLLSHKDAWNILHRLFCNLYIRCYTDVHVVKASSFLLRVRVSNRLWRLATRVLEEKALGI